MKPQQIKQLKALFLLLVFSLNTLAGFACSVGVNMGYNSNHHEPGKSSDHKRTASHHQHHHKQQQLTASRFHVAGLTNDCCAKEVAGFALLEKSVSVGLLKLQAPVFLLAFAAAFSPQAGGEASVAVNSSFQFVRRSCFLNDTDLCIATRSFRI